MAWCGPDDDEKSNNEVHIQKVKFNSGIWLKLFVLAASPELVLKFTYYHGLALALKLQMMRTKKNRRTGKQENSEGGDEENYENRKIGEMENRGR